MVTHGGILGQRRPAAGAVALLAVIVAIALGVDAHLSHAFDSGLGAALTHGLRDTLVSIPLVYGATLVGLELYSVVRRRLSLRQSWLEQLVMAESVALATSLVMIPGAILHGRLLDATEVSLRHAVTDGVSLMPVALVAALAVVVFARVPLATRPGDWVATAADGWAQTAKAVVAFASRIGLRAPMHAALAVSVIAAALVVGPVGNDTPAEAAGPLPQEPCVDGPEVDRSYEISAINVVIPRNRWGDVDLHGQAFVLNQDIDAVRYWAFPLDDPAAPTADRRLRPRPLVLRANEGECVEITLTNELDVEAKVPTGSPQAYQSVNLPGEGLPTNQWVSLHVSGMSFNAKTSSGSGVGFNDDSGVAPGGSYTYYLRAPKDEGIHFMRDASTLAGSEADGGSIAHGLYGAFVVEPAGSKWFDPVSGLELSGTAPYANVNQQSGELYLDAIIEPAPGTGVPFRESLQISQDEMPGVHLQNCDLAAADSGQFITEIKDGVEVSTGRPDRSSCQTAHTTTKNSFQFGLGLGFNYGEEHLLLRQHPINRCANCVGEETWLSSWPYGDPSLVKLASGFGPWYPRWHPWYDGGNDGVGANDGQQNFDNKDNPEDCDLEEGCYTANVPHSYQWDATKIRFLHAGPKETHVFHMHAHQWLSDPQDIGASGKTPGQPSDANMPEATTLDSQTYGPGEGFTIDLLFGAGSKPGTVGDSIFHCHLYPHFAEGFWSLFRVHDVLEQGSGVTPDGIKVRAVAQLPSPKVQTPTPTAMNPGYPRFIPGEEGWRAPQPPLGIRSTIEGTTESSNTIERNDLEWAVRNVADQDLVVPKQEIVVEAIPVADGLPPGAPSFRLQLGGEITPDPDAPEPALEVGATAAQVEEALERLDQVGDATVTGDGTLEKPYVVEFLILDAGNRAPTIQLTVLPDDATGYSQAVWDDDGVNEARATDMAYRLSLERAVQLRSHNDGIWDDREGLPVYDPLKDGDPVSFGAQMPKPGSPLVDPCPANTREVTYNISMVQLDVTYNDNGWHDSQARVLVLNEDLPDILAGRKPVEPFFFRANSGDCVNLNMTNLMPNWFGNDDFLELIQTNMSGQHIHLVKFDVTGSDGSSNGWNWQQAAFSEPQDAWERSIATGQPVEALNELAHTKEVKEGIPVDCKQDVFDGADLKVDGCRIPLPDYWNPQWTCEMAGGCPIGQTISERWYIDYDLRTIFTHDHHFPAEDQNRGLFAALVVEPKGMDVRDPFTGEYKQPINDGANGTPCGSACVGEAAGTKVDVIGPAADDDFREYSLAMQDFVSLYRPCSANCEPSRIAGEEPLAAPEHPEGFPLDDPGVMGINYRNAPFLIRDSVGGVRTDPAYVFSSTVHGDPDTPLLEAYEGDPIRVRLIQGSQEEQHVVQIHGMSWQQEPDDPESPIVDSVQLGISEAFNFEIPKLNCGAEDDCYGDYLYGGTSTDDLWTGAWGLMRVYGKGVKGLLPLPDNVPQAVNGNTNFAVTGSPPPKANKPGEVCELNAPLREYHVIAVDTRIDYNDDGDHDPYGLVYAVVKDGETPEEAADRVRASNPEPMVLRAHEGDCLEVTLTNMIDPQGAFATDHAPHGANQSGNGFDPPLVLEPSAGTPAGLRVSLHAGLVDFDVRGSDGATIGFNRDQTVGPNESIMYRWYAADVDLGELGAINLTDFGDVRGHRHHGLFGGLVIEPRGSTWADPVTGELGTTKPQADIRLASANPEGSSFREFVTFYQDGLNLWDINGANVPDPWDHPPADGEPGQLPDSEDRGEKGMNYRSEPFSHRLNQPLGAPLDGLDGEALAHVFSSVVHGDPDTPVFRAYAGDDIRWRVLQGADKPRQHSFTVAGHSWLRQPHESEDESERIGTQGGISVGRALNLHMTAGGLTEGVGDYWYGDQVLDHKLSGGWWGLLRVYDGSAASVPADPMVTEADNPHTPGYRPILPLSANTIAVEVKTDHDGDGKVEKEDGWFTDVDAGLEASVHPQGDPTTVIATVKVGADGRAWLPVVPGLYDVSLTPTSDDYKVTTLAPITVDASSVAAPAKAEFAVTRLGDIAINVLYDSDGPGGEPAAGWDGYVGTAPIWTVQLVRGGETVEATAGVDGVAEFTGLLPGNYKVALPLPGGWGLSSELPVIDLAENGTAVEAIEVREVAGLSLHLFNDVDEDGVQDPGEDDLDGWSVSVVPSPSNVGGSTPAPQLTNAVGAVTFEDVLSGSYQVRANPDRGLFGDWTVTSFTVTINDSAQSGFVTAQTDCGPEPTCRTWAVANKTTNVNVGLYNPHRWIDVQVFDDTNNNGVKDGKERVIKGLPVTLNGGALPDKRYTGNDGVVSFYVLAVGGPYSFVIDRPEGGDSSINWYRTPFVPGPTTPSLPTGAVVSDGDPGTTTFLGEGVIRPGTISVEVFHDRDGDRFDDGEDALGGRLVRLLAPTGNTKTAITQKYTDVTGSASFQVAASTDFRVQVLTPVGWVTTTPLASNGNPTDIEKVTSAAKVTDSVTVRFGQRELVDTTPPPTPVANPPGGSDSSGSVVVGLTSETGAEIRYTLDGSDPKTGTLYSGQITLGIGTWTLKAIARDAAGLWSGVLSETYTVTNGGGGPGAPPATTDEEVDSIAIVSASSSSGVASDLREAADGNASVKLTSRSQGQQRITEMTATVTGATAPSTLSGLTINYASRQTISAVDQSIALWNNQTGAWEVVWITSAPTAWGNLHTIDISGDPNRFRSKTGELRIQVATRKVKTDHELAVDRLWLTLTG